MDWISGQYPECVLQVVFPLIISWQKHDCWWIREVAALACGVIHEATVTQQSDKYIDFCMRSFYDLHPYVYCVTAWTISKYSTEIISHGSNVNSIMMQVLRKSISPYFSIRESTLTALVCF